jgi:hypothetical protein
MDPKLEERLLQLEVQIARRATETLALRQFASEIALKVGWNPGKIQEFLNSEEDKAWDSFLRYVEDTKPGKAAQMDTRTIDQVPTDAEDYDQE